MPDPSEVAGGLHAPDDRTAAFDAFVRFTEASSRTTHSPTLAELARDVLRSVLPDMHVVYYELDEHRWRALVFSDNLPESFVTAARDGFAEDTPAVRETFRARGPVFFEAWNARAQGAPSTDIYYAGAMYPYVHGDRPHALLAIGLTHDRALTERDRAVFRSVGRSLELAFERAERTRQLEAQNAELAAQNAALKAFEEWTRDLNENTDAYALIERAQALLYSLLPIDVAVYYEREGHRWFVKRRYGEFGNDDLERAHAAGLPHDRTGNLRVPYETRATQYQDVYDLGTDGLARDTRHVTATAMVPLRCGAGVRGVFGLASFGQRGWTVTQRRVIESVGRSLEVALDRADKAADLARERERLAAANEELEAFAYSVSHDLRTPVRHVLGFNELLRKTLGDGLDPKAARYLTMLDDAGQRMNTLIDAMLNLSRTSRQPLRPALVDLGVLVHEVRAELTEGGSDRDVRWSVASLPLVMADGETLRQVVVNLLSNALKYTRTRETARIEVWAEDRPEEWAVFVRDNGVGFDPKYTDKLFGVFSRLHRQEEFEGTGVGLANVRRVVARHGGTVSASGAPNEGATFGFTLPKP